MATIGYSRCERSRGIRRVRAARVGTTFLDLDPSLECQHCPPNATMDEFSFDLEFEENWDESEEIDLHDPAWGKKECNEVDGNFVKRSFH